MQNSHGFVARQRANALCVLKVSVSAPARSRPAAGSRGLPLLLQCRHCMADWKQITARIRRARTAKDPAAQLSNLYEKTRDAMVAFELARYFETSGQNPDAAKWYLIAAERFRRTDWKTKAQEAAVRLGAEPLLDSAESASQPATPSPAISIPEPGLPFEQNAAAFEAFAPHNAESAPADAASSEKSADGVKRRRRGRRGGRNRRKSTTATETAAAAPATSHARTSSAARHVPQAAVEAATAVTGLRESLAIPPLPIDSMPDTGGIPLRGRYGDPGLSSRLSLLEMHFRRLLTCPPAKVGEADHAPVGPGVFLLTDSDLTSYYYVESCQTLRIAIGNLLRGGASRRGAESIKPQLADHLGIAESRVSKYLADHCVVRWLQLDEGASHFAHFVVSVLRPTLNE